MEFLCFMTVSGYQLPMPTCTLTMQVILTLASTVQENGHMLHGPTHGKSQTDRRINGTGIVPYSSGDMFMNLLLLRVCCLI